MRAKDIMSVPVFSVGPETSVSEIAALLVRRGISGVPVLEDGRLVGLVNEMDLLHRHEIGTEQIPVVGPWWARFFRADKAPARYVKSHALKARDIMTRYAVSVVEDAELSTVATLFDSRVIRRVQVVCAEKVIGIITRADLVQALAASAQHVPGARTKSDEEIRRELLGELERQLWWRREWSTLTVTDGAVQFRGVIDTEDERHAARVAAENVPGVRTVEDLRERYVDVLGRL
jgi:CBS domain-containing protein